MKSKIELLKDKFLSIMLLKNLGRAGKMSLDAGMEIATRFFLAIMTLGILGFALVIVLGNLEGASGFAAGSANANTSDAILTNLTQGTASFFANATSWFTLLSVVIIIAIVVVVIVVVRSVGKDSSRDL